MYKITRIFASDIVAGANILQQACFPIYNPENEAGPLTQSSQDHGVIFAANGTCKTTLISFLLNTFYPDQNRFVQHIQSGGDKTMGQYLVPGRPAIILIEMAVPSEQTLFGEEKEERLVIGQYFISKRGAQKPFDRFNFQAASPDLFNRVKDNWQHLTAAPQPDAAVREFIDPLITIAGTQKEWFEKLEKIGLDPWLINRQINFARNEGGIKDAFRFRAESDFLEFFLGCVTDMTYAEKLRDETLRCMGKIKDRPEKKSRLNAIITLKSHLQNFDRIAGQWRNASKEQVRCRQDLEQASFLAAKALPEAAEQKAQVQKNLEQILARKEKIEKQLQQTGADQFKARKFALGQDEEAYRKKVIELSGSLEKIDRELNALGAADIQAQIHMIKEQIQVKTNALEESGADLDPLRREVDQKAKEFHISLAQKYKKIEGKIFSSKQRLASADEDRDSCQKEIEALSNKKTDLEKNITRMETRLSEAEKSRQNIWGQNQALPEEIRARLERTLLQTQKDLEQKQDRLSDLEKHEKTDTEDLQLLMNLKADARAKCDTAGEKKDKEKLEREALLQDPHIQTVIGSATFDPGNAVHVSSLAGAVQRKSLDLGRVEKEARTIAEELTRLKEMHTLAVEPETHRLISHCRDQGLKKSEIRAYPEYLASMNMDPDTRAKFFHRDPARFTGILAMNPDILDQITALEIPAWLKRPVVVSLPCSRIEEVGAISHRVIAPVNPDIYTTQGADRLKESLTQNQQQLEEEIATLGQIIEDMKASEDALKRYRKKYPDASAVRRLTLDVESAEQDLDKTGEQIREQNKKLEKAREQIKGLQDRRGELEGELAQQKEQLHQAEHWLDQYGKWESWDEKILADRLRVKILTTKFDEVSTRHRSLEKKLAIFNNEIVTLKKDLEHLDELGSEVPLPDGFDPELDLTSETGHPDKDPGTLKKLYFQAIRDKDKLSIELGIDALEREVDELKERMAEENNRFKHHKAATVFEYNKAMAYAVWSHRERQKEKKSLENQKETENIAKIRSEADAGHAAEEQKKIAHELTELSHKGIFPRITHQDLLEHPPDELSLTMETQKAGLEKELQNLGTQINQSRAANESINEWYHQLKTLEVLTREYIPETYPTEFNINDSQDWPDLLHPELGEANCKKMEDRVQALKGEEKQKGQQVKELERKLSRLFDDLKIGLLNDTFARTLPTLVNELKGHDAESLGKNSRNLIEKCSDIAQTLEGDLLRSKRIMTTHISMLLEHAKDCYQKLNAATRVTIPDTVYTYGGLSILKATDRLNFTRYNDVYKKSLENWIDELIQNNICPQVNPNSGNCLGSDLLYRLLGVEAKKTFNIRLLKCDDTGKNYEPVGRDLGSGGEALTTSVLLYALLVSMRKKRFKGDAQRMPAFLILDNPLGVCNRPDFLDAQLKVAQSLGVQCIYLTGINDTGSIELFPHRIVIRKGNRQLTIDDKVYDKLETIEAHLEG